MEGYELLDSGDLTKMERFGSVILKRPCLSAPWALKTKEKADGTFTRDPKGKWTLAKKIPRSWIISHDQVKMKLEPTDFGHLGIFPEHKIITDQLKTLDLEGKKILNLFAYTGYGSIFCALKKALVTHVDASKPSTLWAKENASLNGKDLSIRFIVDDVLKFLKREVRRGSSYDGIILDPPSFGRGPKGELFKIENDFVEMMRLIRDVFSEKGLFIALSCHTPGYLPSTLKTMLLEMQLHNNIQTDEMVLESKKGKDIAVGCYALWKR